MRISVPGTNQFAILGGLMQGANQAQDRQQRNSLAQQQLAQGGQELDLRRRGQAHREDMDREGMDFERFKFGEAPKQQSALEELRDRLLANREAAGRTFQGGERAKDRTHEEGLTGLREAGADRRSGAEITSRETEGGRNRDHADAMTRLQDLLMGGREDKRMGHERAMAGDQRDFTSGMADKQRGWTKEDRDEDRTDTRRRHDDTVDLTREGHELQRLGLDRQTEIQSTAQAYKEEETRREVEAEIMAILKELDEGNLKDAGSRSWYEGIDKLRDWSGDRGLKRKALEDRIKSLQETIPRASNRADQISARIRGRR